MKLPEETDFDNLLEEDRASLAALRVIAGELSKLRIPELNWLHNRVGYEIWFLNREGFFTHEMKQKG